MAHRDYKTRSTAPQKKASGGTLMGIVIGLILGLFIAVAVAFYLNKGTKPFADKTGRGDKAVPGKGGGDNADPNKPLFGKDARSGDAGRAAAPPSKEDEGRFSFYKILPGKEDGAEPKRASDGAKAGLPPSVSPAAKTADAPAKSGEPSAAGAKETFFLQAGAFGSPGDADNQKAKLALLGFEARVESIDIEGKGTVHRVRIGPYAKLDDINRVRSTLTQNGVDASLIRLKDQQK